MIFNVWILLLQKICGFDFLDGQQSDSLLAMTQTGSGSEPSSEGNETLYALWSLFIFKSCNLFLSC